MDEQKLRSLHSRYNPEKEAERYIDSVSVNESVCFFILAEPGLGYIIAPLRKKFPNTKIIALHVEEASGYSRAGNSEPDSKWYPQKKITLQDFLEKEISDVPAAAIHIIEWRPAIAVYGSSYKGLIEEAVKFIKRSDANSRTQKVFGRVWLKNFFRNLEIIKKVILPAADDIPVIVTGAGPALERAIPSIKDLKNRNGFFVLAVSSSVPALKASGICPDMIISTDGGGWAKYHLYECFRVKRGTDESICSIFPPPLAASMTAALPSQCAELMILPVSDGSLWQNLLLKKLEIPFINLPQRGTVSASALDLAFLLTRGKIFAAGMDLANMDISSHARPYSLDFFLEKKAERLNPVYSQTYTRSSMISSGGSYGIYAAWFQKQLVSYPKRLYSLGENNAVFGLIEKASSDIHDYPKIKKDALCEKYRRENITLKQSTGLSKKAFAILEEELNKNPFSEMLRKELGVLLFTEQENNKSADGNNLSGAIESLLFGA